MTRFLLLIGLVGCILYSCQDCEVTETKVVTLVDSSKSWDGTELPDYPNEKPKITILKITIPPQTELPPHIHPGINAGYLITGELTVFKEDGTTNTLKAGDALIELVNTVHYGKNISNKPAEIIVFYAGTKKMPLTVYDD